MAVLKTVLTQRLLPRARAEHSQWSSATAKFCLTTCEGKNANATQCCWVVTTKLALN